MFAIFDRFGNAVVGTFPTYALADAHRRTIEPSPCRKDHFDPIDPFEWRHIIRVDRQ